MWDSSFQEAVAIGRTFASMKDYQLDGNKEMVALGTMNIVGSMTSCYVATGIRKNSLIKTICKCSYILRSVGMNMIYRSRILERY